MRATCLVFSFLLFSAPVDLLCVAIDSNESKAKKKKAATSPLIALLQPRISPNVAEHCLDAERGSAACTAFLPTSIRPVEMKTSTKKRCRRRPGVADIAQHSRRSSIPPRGRSASLAWPDGSVECPAFVAVSAREKQRRFLSSRCARARTDGRRRKAPKLLLRLRLEPYGVYAREGKSSLHLIPILDDSGRTD
jgi:hypothetical protein